MRTLAAVLMITLVALAGCSDEGGPSADEEEDAFDDIDLKAGSGTGVIRGVVVDETITPVADATVSIVDSDETTQTNENGAFGFSGLEPGSYFLEVSRVGFDTVQSSATVQAGVDRPPILKVQLPRNPGSVPYVSPTTYTGYVACGLLVGLQLVGAETCNVAQVFGEDDASHWFAADKRPADYLQTEVMWEQKQPGGDRLTVTMYVCDAEGTCSSAADGGQRMCQIWGASPGVCKVSRDAGWGNPDGTGGGDGLNATGFGTGTDPGFVVWIAADCAELLCVPGTAAGVGAVIEQDYTVFNHVFYNFLPDEDWLFVRDGAPQVPQA